MIKIFSPTQIFYLTNSKPLLNPDKNSIFIDVTTKDDLLLRYNEIVNDKALTKIYFIHKNIDYLKNVFASMFTNINAAGGLVKNVNMQWLFIFRNGKWDLPKGKIESGEEIKYAAIREVEEECGITKLNIIKEIPSTYHIYSMGEKTILKQTYWFEMICSDNSPLIPQTEEGITDAKWLYPKEFNMVLENTFDSIKEVLKNIKNV